ncbi:MAG: hypothetical protein AABX38_01225 [Candidatus Micrarchaeota archaeon]
MEPKEFEKKLRDFMKKEMPDYHYQLAVCYTSGKVSPDGNIQITNQIIGFDTKQVPFSIAHALLKSLETSVNSMLLGIYGPMTTSAIKEKFDNSMHR